MQIQITWLLQKPTDLDLHCLQRQGTSGFSRTMVSWTIIHRGCTRHDWLLSNNICRKIYTLTLFLYPLLYFWKHVNVKPMAFCFHLLNGPRQAKECIPTCAKCTDSDHPAQRIIRVFALHSYSLQYLLILLADSEDPDQTVRMRRLIWAFYVRICPKICFRMARLKYE